MTMKIFLKNLWFEVWNFLCYLASIFTNKAVIISAGFVIGGLIGWSFSGAFRIVLYALFGAITIPYTTLPIAISSAAVLGGTTSFFIAQAVAANRWFKNKSIVATGTVVIADAPIAEKAVASESINLDPLVFNPETGILSYHGKTCEVPFKSYQHMLCNKLFERPGRRVIEYDILEEFDRDLLLGRDSRVVRDVVYAINRKTKADLDIKNLVMWSKATVWINEEYC